MPISDKEKKPSSKEIKDDLDFKIPEAEPGKISVEKEAVPVKEAKVKEEKEVKGKLKPIKEKIEKAKPPKIAAKRTSIEEETEKKIEDILEEDLEDTYFQLPEDKRAEFKQEGEEAAWKITDILLHKPKLYIIKIIAIIRKWLKMVPGVNKFFLEQETKIKTEKILEIKKGKK